MVSKTYTARTFFKLQSEGKIARGLSQDKKLRMDSRGYYLNKKSSKGGMYIQRVKATDKVYSRAEGVTMYSKERDMKRTNVTHKQEGIKKHSSRPQFSDREAITGRDYRI